VSLSPEARASLAKFKKGLIDRLPKEITKAAAGAIHEGAQTVAAMARRLAPVNDGDLRDSIGFDVAPDALSAVVYAGDVEVEIGAKGKRRVTRKHRHKAFYAWFQEFGTVKMNARPFFFPAYRANRKRIMANLSKAIRKAKKATGYTT
jgi:HK97 gp10 family phage protein